LDQQDVYFEYLKTRGTLALLYRRGWLYPRLNAQLSGKVLDIGCGIGDMLKARRGAVGVDVNPRLVDYCRRQGLDAHLMSADRLPFESATFEGVVLDNVLEHISDPRPLLTESRRVLAKGGRMVIGVPGSFGFTLDADHKQFYSESQLHQRMCDVGFAVVRTLYSPFKSRTLDSKLAWYAVYGVYEKRDAD
jgi:SAM-dependent methyltransferase